MKTVKQWLEELDEPYRTQALENLNERTGNGKAESQAEALLGAFNWGDTLQGHKYWIKLRKNLLLLQNGSN